MSKRDMLSGVAIMVIVGLAAACAGAEDIPSASNLLDRYTQALDSTKSFIEHYELSKKFSYRVEGLQDEGENFKYGQVRHDDQRIYRQEYTWGDFNLEHKDVPKDKPYYRCNITNGKDKMVYQHNRWINNPDISGAARRQPYLREKKVSLSRNFGISYIVGYIGSDERLDAILRKAARISVRETTENVGGSECFVIDAYTKCGQYSVWLDPEHGFHPAKVRRRAKGGNYTHSRLLSKGETALTYLDTVRFEKVDDLWVPMEANAGCDRVTPQGYFVKEDIHYKRTQIISNPDHDKLGSFADPILEDPNNDPELRNGTHVRLNNLPIQYTWQDGELIPNIDEAVIDEIDKMTEEIMAETIRTKSTIAPMGATVSELLKKYAETQDKLRSFIAKGESTIEYIKIPRQSGRMQKELCEFRTDGSRVNHRGSVWNKLLSKDKVLYKSFLWDGESFIQYRQGSQLTDSTVFIEKNDDSKKRMIATEYKGATLMGICGGDYDRIDSILRKADNISLRQKTEQVGNSQCYVIDAVTKRGKYRVWIDPEHGYNIAKIELQKRKGDMIGSSERVKIGMLFLLENVRFEKIDDVWVPVEADMKQYQDDHISIIKWHHKRTKIILNPDHEVLGSFIRNDVRNGTRVIVKDVGGITYTWQNGQVVDKQGRVIADFRKNTGKAHKENNSDAKR